MHEIGRIMAIRVLFLWAELVVLGDSFLSAVVELERFLLHLSSVVGSSETLCKSVCSVLRF